MYKPFKIIHVVIITISSIDSTLVLLKLLKGCCANFSLIVNLELSK